MIERLANINFRIAEKLNNLEISFEGDDSNISIFFGDETKKNTIGDTLKKKIKKIQNERTKKEQGLEYDENELKEREYKMIEFKYKLAKMLECFLKSREH